MPAIYNSNRISERPIPLLSPSPPNDTDEDSEDNLSERPIPLHTPSLPPNDTDMDDQHSQIENINVEDDPSISTLDAKQILQTVRVDDIDAITISNLLGEIANENTDQSIGADNDLLSDSVAGQSTENEIQPNFENVYIDPNTSNVSNGDTESIGANGGPDSDPFMNNQDNENISENLSEAATNLILAENETSEEVDGKTLVTRNVGDGCEMVYVYGESVVPQNAAYEVKLNDEISKNIAFKENVDKDRAYMIKIDGSYTEVSLAASFVMYLKAVNSPMNRENSDLDKPFIKALLVGLCSIKTIKSTSEIDKGYIAFIKGKELASAFHYFIISIHQHILLILELFAIRVDGFDITGERYLSFKDKLDTVCQEIRQ